MVTVVLSRRPRLSLGVLDTRTLSAAEAADLEAIIQELERLEGRMQEAAVGADLFRYDVETQDNRGRRRHLVLPHEGDPDVPPPQPLARLLGLITAAR